MKKSISLDEVVRGSCKNPSRNPVLILDTNIWRYRIMDSDYQAIITPAVIEELGNFPEHFPEEQMKYLGLLINPIVALPCLDQENLEIINQTMKKIRTKEKRRKISKTDKDLLLIWLEKTKARQETILISDDKKISAIARQLITDVPQIQPYAKVASVQEYLERKYGKILGNHEKQYRLALTREITSQYSHAA